MRLRRILLGRFVVVPVMIAVTAGLWNIYVALHAHGLLSGRVVDEAGHPVRGADVILFEHDFVTQVEKARTSSDAGGDFVFTNNGSHLVQLQAQKGRQASPRMTIRLWFRGQDRVVQQPLMLVPFG
jgi:hypothetical protein